MKVFRIEIDDTGTLISRKDIIERIDAPAYVVVNMLEKGDKPIKGVDYFTKADREELTREIQLDAGFDTITEGDIMNLF